MRNDEATETRIAAAKRALIKSACYEGNIFHRHGSRISHLHNYCQTHPESAGQASASARVTRPPTIIPLII